MVQGDFFFFNFTELPLLLFSYNVQKYGSLQTLFPSTFYLIKDWPSLLVFVNKVLMGNSIDYSFTDYSWLHDQQAERERNYCGVKPE